MSTVALVVHGQRRAAVELAHQAAEWLTAHGHQVRVPKADAHAVGLDPYASDADDLVRDLDLVVSLGGDGTILRAVHLVARQGVPVLGVNLGYLGYLTEVEPPSLIDALGRYLAGDYSLEERMMLTASVVGASSLPGEVPEWALNEMVVEKASPGRTVRVAVSIGGRPFQTYSADGIIVATPTGSTAYAFSARGPIISPRQEALLVTPVSPHNSFDRSLVLHPTEAVRLELVERPAVLTLDGREVGSLDPGDVVECAAASLPARFVRFGPRDFYGILTAKFGLVR